MPDAHKSICKYCGQKRWLDVSGDTVFYWCVCGCPIEEVSEEELDPKAGADPDLMADLGCPVDHLSNA